MTRAGTPADLLRGARALLATPESWRTGGPPGWFATAADGGDCSLVQPTRQPVRWTLYGALAWAGFGQPPEDVLFSEDAFTAALFFLGDAGVVPWNGEPRRYRRDVEAHIHAWNDAPQRRHAAVLRALDAAIRLAAPPAPVLLTRDDAEDLLREAAFILSWRIGCGIQGDGVRWMADQVMYRGPVWMRRQAREYRRTKILLSRETGGNGTNMRSFNVRASLFVSAVLLACAAYTEQR